MIVKMGEKYCKTTAIAIGKFCSVKKNMVNAAVPNIPLINNHFRLFPNSGSFFRLIIITHNVSETTDLKKTNSCAGKPSNVWPKKGCPLKILMQRLTTAKHIEDKSMYTMPRYISLQSL